MALTPARGVNVASKLHATETWAYVKLEEQQAVLGCARIPEADRLLIAWQMLTGMRPSETASLRIEDVHLTARPYVTVRFGKEGLPPKNGKIRRVELLGAAVAVAKGKPARLYDLRHTCASSLAAGWWGRRWSLLEIKEALGHSLFTPPSTDTPPSRVSDPDRTRDGKKRRRSRGFEPRVRFPVRRFSK